MSFQFPSRFNIGEEVLFKNFGSDVMKAKIVSVKFTESKVLYGLALWLDDKKNYYTVLPINDVDSVFVQPLE